MDNICLKRYSCRCFRKERVPEEALIRIFQAAMQAPSALNEQPWEFLLIREACMKREVAGINPYCHPAAEADCLILLLADLNRLKKDSPWWVQDMSACAENMLLQAVVLGLGAVWLGVYPREERMKKLSRLVCLPENVIPFAVISVGYPDEERDPVLRFDGDRIYGEQYGTRLLLQKDSGETER